MVRSRLILMCLAGALSVAAACSSTPTRPNSDDDDDDDEGDSTSSTMTSSQGSGGSSGTLSGGVGGMGGDTGVGGMSGATGVGGMSGATGVGGMTGATGVGGGGGNEPGCNNPPNVDGDGDGFTGLQGDCNDCDPGVNPGAIEVLGNPPTDEDCDGQIDNLLPACDDTIDLADFDPQNGAKVLDICKVATVTPKSWGVLKAEYVRADGSPASPSPQVGVLTSFGPNVTPRRGSRMLGFSSGHARSPSQPDACGSHSCATSGMGTAPPGFPQSIPSCEPAGSNGAIRDDVGIALNLRAPTNATGFSFDFTFYTFEYPEWVCSSHYDQFVALVTPPPFGSVLGTVAYSDDLGIVGQNSLFRVCAGCQLGTAELAGTGFDVWNDAGATGWHKTTAPVDGGGEIAIRFALWDGQDQSYDSTVIVDNLQWITGGGMVKVTTTTLP